MEKAEPNAKADVQKLPGGEQGAELAAILNDAQQGGAPAAPAAPGASVDEAEKWAAMPMMFGNLIAPVMPELRPVFSEANCKAWGAAMAPVAKKYSINVDSFVGVELSLFMATVPFVAATVLAIKARRAVPDTQPQGQAGTPAGPGQDAAPSSEAHG